MHKISYLRSNIIGDFNIAVGTCTLSMHNSLGDSLTSKVSKLVKEVEVLSEDGATGTSGHRVLVVVDGSTGARGDNFSSFSHGVEFLIFFQL